MLPWELGVQSSHHMRLRGVETGEPLHPSLLPPATLLSHVPIFSQWAPQQVPGRIALRPGESPLRKKTPECLLNTWIKSGVEYS